ncbi:hypothetical protein GM3708_2626 [Geminocystis sp. NIES-3708]|nr:hypothetical protein GM3708_2626 [Geminocystis sp. NIES-3708]
MLACLNLERNYIGMKKEEKYINFINQRVTEHKLILSI